MTVPRPLWLLAMTLGFCAHPLLAQTDSASDSIPNLSGAWNLTETTAAGWNPTFTGMLPAHFTQDKHVLRVEIIDRGNGRALTTVLFGTVEGHVVEFLNAQGPLVPPGFRFKGKLAEDDHKIVGPYYSHYPSHYTHVWTFSR